MSTSDDITSPLNRPSSTRELPESSHHLTAPSTRRKSPTLQARSLGREHHPSHSLHTIPPTISGSSAQPAIHRSGLTKIIESARPSTKSPGPHLKNCNRLETQQKQDKPKFPPGSRYHLFIRQQPIASRASGDRDRDRRPIDPPPILQLLLTNFDPDSEDDISVLEDNRLTVGCTICPASELRFPGPQSMGGDEERNSGDGVGLGGKSFVSSFFVDEEPDPDTAPMHPTDTSMFTISPSYRQPIRQSAKGIPAAFFIFSDLSVRAVGQYRLNFRLMNWGVVEDHGQSMPILAEVWSDPFRVYPAKDFPGVKDASILTVRLRELGCGGLRATDHGQGKGRAIFRSSSPNNSFPAASSASIGARTPDSTELIGEYRSGTKSQNKTDQRTLSESTSWPYMRPSEASEESSRHRAHTLSIPDNVPVVDSHQSKRTSDESWGGSHLVALLRQGFISDLSHLLSLNIRDLRLSDRILSRLSELLPDILKAFALKMGYETKTSMERNIMVLVYTHRWDITRAFIDEVCAAETNHDPISKDRDKSSPQELVEGWLQDLEKNAAEPEAQVTTAPSLISQYRTVLVRARAYSWLLKILHREASVMYPEPNVMDYIRRTIMWHLPTTRGVNGDTPADAHNAVFEVDWHPLQMIREQCYKEPLSIVIETALTLTGTRDNAQALPCAHYMQQMWPLTGSQILDLIKAVLWAGPGVKRSCALYDGTLLSASANTNKFQFEVTGTAWAVGELGEQLSWLGAALHTSRSHTGLISCTPSVDYHGVQDPRNLNHSFTLKFLLREIDPVPSIGHCWRHIFTNPVIVEGFPIRFRNELDTGIDIPLNIMATVARTPYVTLFDGRVFLKGFSTMIVPTKVTKCTVTWHVLFNADMSHISYFEPQHRLNTLYPEGISMSHLSNCRHILGWCSEIKSYAGDPHANYDIRWSGLNKPPTGGDFEKIYIHRGRLVQGGVEAVLGNRDRPSHIIGDDYLGKLKWISEKFVILYDVNDKRGWCVDGASALLHLLRAGMKHDENRVEFRPTLLFNWDQFSEAGTASSAKSAAITVLNHEANKNLRLYSKSGDSLVASVISPSPNEDATGYVLLKDQIELLFNILEQIISHQEQVGVDREFGLRKRKSIVCLEGFDFMDIATAADLSRPRCVEIQSRCQGWVELLQAVSAVTLFGDGFGDIIKPILPGAPCNLWAVVPRDKDYLSVCVSDIKEILKKGNTRTQPWRPIHDLIWHTLDKTFESCHCDEINQSKCSWVQLLLPESLFVKQPGLVLRSPNQLIDCGAVIFGPNPPFLISDDQYENKKCEESIRSYAETASSFTDSGVGESELQAQFNSSTSSPKRLKRKKTTSSPAPISRSLERHSPNLGLEITPPESDIMQSHESRRFESVPPRSSTIIRNPDEPHKSQDRHSKPPREAYTVGWMCAIALELKQAVDLLNETYGKGFGQLPDHNLYTLGRIGATNVVICCLPMGRYGNNAAAIAATRMLHSFPNIKIGLMVGIGGGIPNIQKGNDVRLGDVVISRPENGHGGVVQYDMGKFTKDGFELAGCIGPPPETLLSLLNYMPAHATPLDTEQPLPVLYPGDELDCLFNPDYQHACSDVGSCQNCDRDYLIQRRSGNRETHGPYVFYGTIASGNALVKDGITRQRLSQINSSFLCFEMEAAGLMSSNFPFLVIRGISDYADSHKNDAWQEYAAAAAAKYAKNLILTIPGNVEDLFG